MLTPYNINSYCEEFKPEWACTMPAECPPENVLVPCEHPFFRLANQADSYTADDFKSYAEADPQRNWGERLMQQAQTTSARYIKMMQRMAISIWVYKFPSLD